jgi:formylglycine-generating enzyme required for sulfatase activity
VSPRVALALCLSLASALAAWGCGDDEPKAGTSAAACETAPPGMACVPGGWFVRGADAGPENARPAERVWVSTFYMDRVEVTNQRWRACRRARQCPAGGPRYRDFSRPRQPIVGVSWHAAVALCAFEGKRLPTEAEWEKAARGPDGALHPWGDEPADCTRAVIEGEGGRGCGLKKAGKRPEIGRTHLVGSRPAGAYGLHDLSGNAWEWVADWYSESYAACGADCRGPDPRGPCGGTEPCPGYTQKIVRGGSWYWPPEQATAIWRRPHFPSNEPFHHFGFRCAATPEQATRIRR